jgi:glycosyltransferase involved in cell wall biosynthesis
LRIAFHTPLNAPDDGRISGDRRMARQIVAALERLGHEVAPIADARAYLATPDPERLAILRETAAARGEALIAGWAAAGSAPDLWFTYHSYYKAPDLLGPDVAARFGIPYVVAEASDSKRRAGGDWATHVALARAGIAAADLHLCFTDRDRQSIAPLCAEPTLLLDFPPFIDAAGPRSQPRSDGESARLITVAMMRDGVKHESYLALARTLLRIADRPWTLTVIGDGPRRADVEHAFATLPPDRIVWRGALDQSAVASELAGHDIFVWPGIGEAYGLVYLEAQAAGLPVAAFASGGVPATVKPGETALLAPESDEAELAAALARLIDAPPLRRSMGEAAARFVRTERMLDSACAILDEGLGLAIAARSERHGATA